MDLYILPGDFTFVMNSSYFPVHCYNNMTGFAEGPDCARYMESNPDANQGNQRQL